MRDFLRQFLLYSRSERRAVVALTVLIVLIVIAPRAYHLYTSSREHTIVDTTLAADIAAFEHRAPLENEDTISHLTMAPSTDTGVHIHRPRELFYFDPNTVGMSEWQRLGLSEKQAAVVEKYKSKGGHFWHPDDLRKIYVMSEEMKDRLVPYVRIADVGLDSKKLLEMREHGIKTYTIDINTADSAAFEALRGIGPALSIKILRYRERLGGFVTVDQIAEVRGIRDSVFDAIRQHLTVRPIPIRQININEADYETMHQHPYIHAKIAKQIMAYRESTGKFENVDELRQLWSVNDAVMDKLRPYVTVE